MQNQRDILTKYHSFRMNADDFKVLHQNKTDDPNSIYTVLQQQTGKIYSAQIIKSNGDENAYKQTVNQIIRTLFKCQHSTLIHFVGYSLKDFYGQNNATIYMEHSSNSLSKLLQEGQAIEPTNIQIILIGITRAMMYLNEHNITQFELKAENILLDEKLQPHLINFLPYFQKVQKTIKTADIYTSPEIIERKPFTKKSNVYSFGILMYQMLVNASLYPTAQNNDEERLKFIEKVVSENYRPNLKSSTIKESFKEMIEKCWSKDPNERPSFNELFERLSNNLENSFYDVYEENKYYLDNIDIEKVHQYTDNLDNSTIINSDEMIEKIKKLKEELNQLEDEIIPLRRENKKLLDLLCELKPENSELKEENIKLKQEILKLKKSQSNNNETQKIDITINEFNLLPLQSKQSIISEIIHTLPEFTKNQFFINVNNLLLLNVQ